MRWGCRRSTLTKSRFASTPATSRRPDTRRCRRPGRRSWAGWRRRGGRGCACRSRRGGLRRRRPCRGGGAVGSSAGELPRQIARAWSGPMPSPHIPRAGIAKPCAHRPTGNRPSTGALLRSAPLLHCESGRSRMGVGTRQVGRGRGCGQVGRAGGWHAPGRVCYAVSQSKSLWARRR